MSDVLGEAFIPIRATLDKLDKDLDAAKGIVEGALNKIGSMALGGIGAGIAAVGTAFLGLGTFAFKAAETVDSAYDSIQVATGKTGEELAGLQKDFREVFRSVPADAATVADVIGVLGSRTTMTNEQITDLGKSLVQLADLTGGDAKTQTENYTRLMGDWGVANEDAAGTLDMIFKASQATGTSVDDLMTKVVQFGAPLRLMGFTLEESVGLFGKWEKEGVNAELVMGSLRIAAGKFAAEGKPLRESLTATFDAIKNNTNGSEALALAMEVFGAKAGPDMAAAIREGRFELGDLLTTMTDSEAAIAQTAFVTMDFGEKLTLLKNRAILAVEPIGTAMMDAAGRVMDYLLPAFEQAMPVIEQVVGVITGLIEVVTDFVGALMNGSDPLMSFQTLVLKAGMIFGLSSEAAGQLMANVTGVIEQIQAGITAVQEFLAPLVEFISQNVQASDVLIALGIAIASVVIPALISVLAAVAPVIAVFVGLVALVALVRTAWEENWGGIQEKTAEVWATIQPLLEQAWTWLQVNIPAALETLRAYWVDTVWPAIQNAIATVWPVIVDIFTQLWTWITVTLIPALTDLYTQWTTVWWPAIQVKLQEVWAVIQEIFTALWTYVTTSLIPTLTNLYTQWTTVWWPAIQKVLQAAWAIIQPIFVAVSSFVLQTLIPTIVTLYLQWLTSWNAMITILTNWTTVAFAIFAEVGRWINDNIMPWVKYLSEQWSTVWWPAIQKAIEDMWKLIKPIWEEIQKWMEKTIPPILAGLQTTFENVMTGISDAVSPVNDMWKKFVDAVQDFATWITSTTFDFKINLPDLPAWAIPGSPLPIHTAWKNFASDADRIFPTLNAGMLSNAPTYETVSEANTANYYSINASTPLANDRDLVREVRIMEMMNA
jgi:phage-related minor tail protein